VHTTRRGAVPFDQEGWPFRGRLRDGGVSLALKARIARYLEACGYIRDAAAGEIQPSTSSASFWWRFDAAFVGLRRCDVQDARKFAPRDRASPCIDPTSDAGTTNDANQNADLYAAVTHGTQELFDLVAQPNRDHLSDGASRCNATRSMRMDFR
jgi:hypothetical protein